MTTSRGRRAGLWQLRGAAVVLALLMSGVLTASLTACTESDNRGISSPATTEEVREAGITVEPANRAVDVAPGEPVIVTVEDGTLQQVTLTDSAGEEIPGETTPDGASWRSGADLAYDKTYQVVVTAQGADSRTVTDRSTFTTVTPTAETFPSMNPLDGETVGVGQPLAIYFDEPIKNRQVAEDAITVTTNPEVEGAFYWFTNEEVHWRPKEFWEPGTKITVEVNIYGKDLGNGVYGKENRTINFEIGDSLIARADGATHQMTVEVNGKKVRTMPISMGRSEFPSSNGTFVVTDRHSHYVMDSTTFGLTGAGAYRTAVDWAVRISGGGEFVHSAPWSVGDQGERNVSHGCINLAPEDAKWFYDTVKKGDLVINSNTGGPDLQPWNGFGDWQIPWDEWVAGGAA